MLQPAEPHRRAHLAPALRLLAAAGAGLLLYLSFQPRPLWWLAPIGFAVLYLTLHGRSLRQGFALGFVAGLAYMYPLLSWTGEFVGPIGSVPLSTMEAALVGVTTAAMTVVVGRRGGYLTSGLVWAAGESLRAVVPFGGFPWAKSAFSQVDGVPGHRDREPAAAGGSSWPTVSSMHQKDRRTAEGVNRVTALTLAKHSEGVGETIPDPTIRSRPGRLCG